MKRLKREYIRTNKFFAVIPVHLIRENQSLRTYFEKILNIKVRGFGF